MPRRSAEVRGRALATLRKFVPNTDTVVYYKCVDPIVWVFVICDGQIQEITLMAASACDLSWDDKMRGIKQSAVGVSGGALVVAAMKRVLGYEGLRAIAL